VALYSSYLFFSKSSTKSSHVSGGERGGEGQGSPKPNFLLGGHFHTYQMAFAIGGKGPSTPSSSLKGKSSLFTNFSGKRGRKKKDDFSLHFLPSLLKLLPFLLSFLFDKMGGKGGGGRTRRPPSVPFSSSGNLLSQCRQHRKAKEKKRKDSTPATASISHLPSSQDAAPLAGRRSRLKKKKKKGRKKEKGRTGRKKLAIPTAPGFQLTRFIARKTASYPSIPESGEREGGRGGEKEKATNTGLAGLHQRKAPGLWAPGFLTMVLTLIQRGEKKGKKNEGKRQLRFPQPFLLLRLDSSW